MGSELLGEWFTFQPCCHVEHQQVPVLEPLVQHGPTPAKAVFNIDTGSEVKKVWIPNSVKDIFFYEAQVPEGNEIATVENAAHTAMLLFASHIDAFKNVLYVCCCIFMLFYDDSHYLFVNQKQVPMNADLLCKEKVTERQ